MIRHHVAAVDDFSPGGEGPGVNGERRGFRDGDEPVEGEGSAGELPFVGAVTLEF